MELKEFAEGVLKGVEEKAGGKLKMRLVPREKQQRHTYRNYGIQTRGQ